MNRDADKTPGEKPEATYETREGSPPKQGTEPRRDSTAASVPNITIIVNGIQDPERIATLVQDELGRALKAWSAPTPWIVDSPAEATPLRGRVREPESTLEGPYSEMGIDARFMRNAELHVYPTSDRDLLRQIARELGWKDSSPLADLPALVRDAVASVRDMTSSLEKAEKAKRHAESNAKSEQDLARIYLERAQNAERANEAIAKEAVAATVAPDYKGQLPAAAAAYRRAREWEREYMAIILGRRNGEAPVKAARRVVAERDDLVVQLAERTRQLSSSLEEQEKLRRVHDRAEARVKELEEARDTWKAIWLARMVKP